MKDIIAQIISNLIASELKRNDGAPCSASEHWHTAMEILLELCPNYQGWDQESSEILQDVRDYSNNKKQCYGDAILDLIKKNRQFKPWDEYAHLEEGSPIPVPATPCLTCKHWDPKTVGSIVKGVRLCWSDDQQFDFSCYRER